MLTAEAHTTLAAPPPGVLAPRKPRAKPRSVAEKYLDDVLAGRIPVSQLVRKQVERHYQDLVDGEARGLYFDRAAAQHVIDFFARFLRHTEGELDGQPFILEPHQQGKLWILYGWKRAATGYRRFKYAYNEVARGNGKSTEASGLCIYEFVAFGEAGAQVYSAATDKKTAKLVFDTADLMVSRSPELRAKIRSFSNNMNVPGTASKFEPCASEDSNLMGLRPSFVCVDELHVHRNSGVWDVMTSAMGKRRNPLIWAITNSGFDRESVCWKKREYSEKVLGGIIEDDTWFAWICGLDPGDDWEDESNWGKANPSLGSMVRIEELREQAMQAKGDPSALNTFLRFRLSVWTSSHTIWMPMEKWDACKAQIDPEKLRGRRCFGGLDLSTTTDMSAFGLLFPPIPADPKWSMLPFFFLPEDAIEQRSKRDRVPYDIWKRQNLLHTTPGAVIDYGFIRHKIAELAKLYSIQEIVFDRWNSSDLVRDLEEDGFTMFDFGQGFASMNAPMKRLMELVLTQDLAHGGHPVLRWNASNVMAAMDPAGNIKPDKSKSREKIDGILATLMSLGRAMLVSGPAVSVYETRGLRSL